MALKQFSKILIFKNTPDTRAAFGVNGGVDTLPSPNATAPIPTTDRKFDGTYPNVNLENFSDSFFQNNLLHSIGVEETGEGTGSNGWNLEPVSSGKGYIFGGYLKAFIVENYDGSVLDEEDLPTPASNTGNVYVVASTNTLWTCDGTAWTVGSAIPFTYEDPDIPLEVGDMLFYGDDPNNLRVAGKILNVYNPGDDEYTQGKRYKLSKDNEPDMVGLSNYQDIYYYRSDWNGKNIPVDVTEGFYVLIGVEISNGQRINYPYLNTNSTTSSTSSSQIVNPGTGNIAFTDLIRVRRISEKYKYDQDRLSEGDETQEIIPCTVKRTNSIKTQVVQIDPVNKTNGMVAFPTTSDFPHWVSYFVNPYGETSDMLLKSTVYTIEINEMLPYFSINNTALNEPNYQLFLNQKV